MDPAPNRLIEIFSQAQAKTSPAERERFLTEACQGQPELRKQVDALLSASERAGDFLAKTIKLEAASVVTEGQGTVIGRYKLLQQIGEGGCGVVYMAEQEEPIRRRVAFKVIKLGMDTKQVIARFEAERQALAMMDHPNIAKVLDAGATDTGRPYFVMELVRGIRITDYCDQNNLSTEQRLDLFIRVCHAIQHAHQKGIIHRDIKPSNILVTINDGVPVPKVIDFGIAKATEQRLTDKTLFTAFEQFIGTPAYMSPEQAEMTSLDIDTRSDIYALGVLLYELLTGQTPFNAKELIAAGVEGMRRIIREQEPVRPSTCISTLGGAAQTTVAKRRQLDPPKLVLRVRGDLDWIVMKCLEKDRTRRYETANGLAQDIQRHLGSEPVSARPPSRLYQFQKLVHRNRLVVAATSLVALALTLGAVVSAWQAVRATRLRVQAQTNEQKALAAEGKEAQQRQKAEEARHNEGQLRKQAQAQAYASDMKAAQVALQQDNRGMAVDLLRRYFPKNGEEDLRGLEWRYLWQETRGDELRTFNHPSMVDTAVLSPDGRYLAAAGRDGQSLVWEVASAKRIREFKGARFDHYLHKSAAFSPDGKWLAIPGKTGVEIRDTAGWALAQELKSATGPFRFSPDGKKFIANGANGLAIWEVDNWSQHVLLTNYFAKWNNLAVTHDASQVAVAPWRSSQLNWCDLRTGARTNLQVSEAAYALEISPDGQWLAGGDWEGEVRLWKVATLQLVQRFQASLGIVLGLAFSPDSALLATGGNDQLIRVWETGTTNKVAEFKGHLSEIWSLEFARDGRTLVSSSKDGTVKLWNVAAGRQSGRVLTLPSNAVPIGALPDGRTLVSIDEKARATQLWNLPDGQLVGSFGWREIDQLSRWNHVHFLANEAVVGVSSNGTVHFWSLATGKLARSVPLGEGGFYPRALSPDSRWLPRQFSDGKGALYDLRSGRRVALPLDSDAAGAPWAFSPDGRWLAFGNKDYAIRIWDLAGEREKMTLKGHSFLITALQFSADSKLLASGSWDDHAALWSMEDGKLLHGPLRGHRSGVARVAFPSDARTLLTGGDDLTMRWWSVATGQEMLRFENIRGRFWCLRDKVLLWQEERGPTRVATLLTLAEIDRAESQQAHAAQLVNIPPDKQPPAGSTNSQAAE